MALAVVTVSVPTAVLLGLQYRSLLELRQTAQDAARETLRQTLYLISAQAEHALVALGDSVLGPLDAEGSSGNGRIAAYLEEARSKHPEIEQVVVIPVGVPGPGSQAAVGALPVAPANASGPLQAYMKARTSTGIWPGPGELSFFHESPRGSLWIFRTMPSRGESSPAPIVGLSVRPEFLLKSVLPTLVRNAQAQPGRSTTSPALVVSVLALTGGRKVELAQVSPGRRIRFEQAVAVGSMLPTWALAAGYEGMTLDGVATRQFRTGVVLVMLVGLVLGAGVVLTVRATVREARVARLKSQFVSNVSHEMRTPLALVQLYAETLVLRRVSSPAKVHEYHQVIQRESRRLAHLVENVLDFGRIEAGRKEYRFERGQVPPVVEEVICAYRDQLRANGFSVTLQVADAVPPVVFDREALAQVLVNLLDNAVKYSREIKQVEVAVQASPEGVVIKVQDHGIGIPRSEHGRIFEQFYRVESDMVRETRGSGLGLALAREIVRAHGGRVEVDSAPGEGSRFSIILPEARESEHRG